MSRDKQIEEMAKDIACLTAWDEDEIPTINCLETAKRFYLKGYRKESEVAREIIKILKEAGIDKWRYPVIDEIEKIYVERKYKKTCPFCKSVCENFIGSNLFCNCSAKYYYFDKIWLNRKTGEEVKESEQ